MSAGPQPPRDLSFGALVREYILPYNTLFAISGVVAFLLGLVSWVLVIAFGSALLAAALAIVLADRLWKARMVEIANETGPSASAIGPLLRLLWPDRDSRLRSSGLFWVVLLMGLAVTIYGVTGPVAGLRSMAGADNAGNNAAAKPRAAARLVVLPFSVDADAPSREAVVAAGIADDVGAGLARFPHLRVMGRATSAAFAKSEMLHPELRQKHAIDYVLSGKLRTAGELYRLDLELVQTLDGTTAWSERMGGPVKELADVPDQVVRAIVARTASHVAQSELRQARASTHEKYSAFELTLQARHLWKGANRKTLPQAQGLLASAIAADPTYAPAYAYLAFTNLTSYNNSWSDGFAKPATLETMLANARKALELDPSNGTAHAAKAIAEAYLGRHAEAMAAARDALKANGNDVDTLGRVGQVLTFSGEHGEAVKVLSVANELDPAGPAQLQNFLARAYFLHGQYEDAVRHARICLERADIEPCRETLAASLGMLDRPEAGALWKAIAQRRGDMEPELMVARLRRAFRKPEDIDHLSTGLTRARDIAARSPS